jgi:hypothetical protein
VSRSRRARNSSWCQPTPFTDAVERATTIDRVIREANPNGRYAKLNLTAYHTHGTVEFRQHQGTTNAQKIENWVKLCLRMVAHAARNTERAGSSGEFVPPAMPLLPVPPRFPDGERDLSRAGRMRRSSIPRFAAGTAWDLRSLTLLSVGVNHHRPDTVTHRMLESCRHPGENLDQLRRRGVSRSWLGFFADRGELVIVFPGNAPTVAATPEEQARRETAVAEHTATVAQMRAEHEAAVTAARAAWEASRGVAAPASRPPTDAAPATLEGLLSLVSAVESERAYFTERQMELN